MVSPQKFLEDFCKDIVANPSQRKELIAGYAKHLEAMLEAARKENASN